MVKVLALMCTTTKLVRDKDRNNWIKNLFNLDGLIKRKTMNIRCEGGEKTSEPILEREKKRQILYWIQSFFTRGLMWEKVCFGMGDLWLKVGGPVESPQSIVTIGYNLKSKWIRQQKLMWEKVCPSVRGL